MYKRTRLERVRGKAVIGSMSHCLFTRTDADFYRTPIVSFYFESLMYFLFLIVYSSSVIFPLSDWTGVVCCMLSLARNRCDRANGDPLCHLGICLHLAVYSHD